MIQFYVGFRWVGTIRNPEQAGAVFHRALMIARILRTYGCKASDIREVRS